MVLPLAAFTSNDVVLPPAALTSNDVVLPPGSAHSECCEHPHPQPPLRVCHGHAQQRGEARGVNCPGASAIPSQLSFPLCSPTSQGRGVLPPALLPGSFLRTGTLAFSVYSRGFLEPRLHFVFSCCSFVLSIFHPVNQTPEENKTKESRLSRGPGK